MVYLISCLFTLSFILYSKWQFDDDRGKSQGKWHTWGFLMRALLFLGIVAIKYYNPLWEDILLAGAINIILFDVGINVFALNKPAFYTGSTSKTDIKLGKIKWFIAFSFLIITIILKLIFKF